MAITLSKTQSVYQKIDILPAQVQHEVSDYVDFLLVKYRSANKKKPKAGCMKGTFTWMSGDFNVPLEDFKDYQ
ncbi:MAG: DUF2281 domain-containing protein [Treponema sp.]|jgi:hypothetical protein|nr:DUF2281 domain-containing protein [Treponema sp.]